MMRLSKQVSDVPVMSLRTGGRIATAIEPIINPNNLKIEGWYCEDAFSKEHVVLLATDIRDFVPQGIAVNDHEALSDPEDLVRLREILELEFSLVGKPVITNHKRRLGKVTDYALDPETMLIQKLYVSRPLYRSLSDSQLTIDRTQIIEITDRRIIVRDADVKAEAPATATAPAI
jgi:sporulation protein YlmC with PRC-barrel domain